MVETFHSSLGCEAVEAIGKGLLLGLDALSVRAWKVRQIWVCDCGKFRARFCVYPWSTVAWSLEMISNLQLLSIYHVVSFRSV